MGKESDSNFHRSRRSAFGWLWVLVVLVALAVVLNHHYQWYPWPWVKREPVMPAVQIPVKTQPPAPKLIDYQKIKEKSDPVLDEEIARRKEEFGLEKSVDMVVASEETIRVGDETVSLSEILAQIEGRSIDPGSLPVIHLPGPDNALEVEDLSASGSSGPSPPPVVEPVQTPGPARIAEYYGVYVVRRGDNLWDIHFAILREYLKNKGIDLPPNADEIKTRNGRSPGVSRILKYAESMVHIFNMKTRKVSSDLGLLEPETKVVVFNLSHLNRILGAVGPRNLDQIQYDGRELHFPDHDLTQQSSN